MLWVVVVAKHYTPEEVSERLPLHPVSIRRACARGDFDGATKRLGRWLIPEQAIEAWLAAGREREPDPGVMAANGGRLRAQSDDFHRAITGGNR